MKFAKSVWIFGLLIILLSTLNAQIAIEWNTFMGSGNDDYGRGIVVDSSGNSYVTGWSDATWGSPINAHSGGEDAYVACLDSSGNLLWNTFLGSSSKDNCWDISLDNSGNLYVVGMSWVTWGTPVNAHSGVDEVFVAKLNSSGSLIWNTFLGSASVDYGYGVATDSSGNVFVTGYSSATWGSPVNAHSGGDDIFVARLDSSGSLTWNTFCGSVSDDNGHAISLDSSGNIYTTGISYATWGTPVSAHSGNEDVFVACLSSSGSLNWNTFLGSSTTDYGWGIAPGNSGNVYITGSSDAAWGSPINAYNGTDDAFVAGLDSSGNLLWNTFLGCGAWDFGYDIILDGSERVYVTGDSANTWGSPINPHNGNFDAYVACLDSSGNLLWNTFYGSDGFDIGWAIALDSVGNIFVNGWSDGSWGVPVNAHSGSHDAFVFKLSEPADPATDIKANGSDGPISITLSDTLVVRVSLDSSGSTANADYWLAYKGPAGWIHYDNSAKKWVSGLGVTHQGPLMDLNNKKVFQSKLSPGNYTFYFGVDMNMDGKVTKSSLYKDEVKVTVTQ